MIASAGKAQVGDGGEPMENGGGGSGGTGGGPIATGGDAGSGEGCDLAHRVGTYVQSFTERAGGTCGALPDAVTAIDDALALPAGCALDAPDKLSADKCDLTRSYTCPLDGAPGTVSIVGFSSESDGGATLSGLLTMRIYDEGKTLVCVSSYDVEFVRQ